MRLFLRTATHTYIAVLFSQHLVQALFFGGNSGFTVFLVVIGLALLYLLLGPVFRLISLPTEGIIYGLLSAVMTFILLRLFSLVLPFFDIIESSTPNLLIFTVMLTSKSLTKFWSAVVSAIIISTAYNFLNWLCFVKKKK